MAAIKKGDLVNLFRRAEPGMGIVLEQVDDVGGALQIGDPRATTAHCRELPWRDRTEMIAGIVAISGRGELAHKFFYYNSSWCKKYKNSFSLVKWFKTPSVFGATELADTGWYPTDWLKTIRKSA